MNTKMIRTDEVQGLYLVKYKNTWRQAQYIGVFEWLVQDVPHTVAESDLEEIGGKIEMKT